MDMKLFEIYKYYFIHIKVLNSRIVRGRCRILERGGGGCTKMRPIRAHARNVFSLLMKFGGPPKWGRSSPLGPPPPGSAPDSDRHTWKTRNVPDCFCSGLNDNKKGHFNLRLVNYSYINVPYVFRKENVSM